jgi:hypothetical protein
MRIVIQLIPYFLISSMVRRQSIKVVLNSYDGAALFMMAMLFLMASGSAFTPVTLFREQRSMGDLRPLPHGQQPLFKDSFDDPGMEPLVSSFTADFNNLSFSEGIEEPAQIVGSPPVRTTPSKEFILLRIRPLSWPGPAPRPCRHESLL